MKSTNIGLAFAPLALLTAANIALDYDAVCAYFDVDMFTNLSFKNALAGVVSVGSALVLLVLPRAAAQKHARGAKTTGWTCMLGSGAIAVILAILRAMTNVKTKNGMDGAVTSGMTSTDAVFVAVMLALALGEIATSYFFTQKVVENEQTRIREFATRFSSESAQIEARIASIDKVAASRKKQAAAGAKAAVENLYLSLLAGCDTQNEYVSIARACEQDRQRFIRSIDSLASEPREKHGANDLNGEKPSTSAQHDATENLPSASAA